MEDNVKEVTKLEEKLIKDGRKELVLEVQRESEAALNERLLKLAKYQQEITTSMKEDVELNATKAKVKEMRAPYSESLKANKLIQRYVSLVIKENEG